MTYKPAYITTDTARNVALVKGYAIADVLRREGMVPLWSAAGRGWILDLRRVPDICACLENAGYVVRCKERGAA